MLVKQVVSRLCARQVEGIWSTYTCRRTKDQSISLQWKRFLWLHEKTLSPVDPGKCELVTDDMSPGVVDQDSHCLVQTAYRNEELEDQDIEAKLTSINDSSAESVSHDCEISAGCYTIHYKPTKRGMHMLSVLINGTDVCNSPFDLMVYVNPMKLDLQPQNFIPHQLQLPYQVVRKSYASNSWAWRVNC